MLSQKVKNRIKYIWLLCASMPGLKRRVGNWAQSVVNPTRYYLDAFRFYYFHLPKQFVNHKKYFSTQSRGFGEKAFHSMWYLLNEKYQFTNFLEIGVYRGQTITLMSLIGKTRNKTIKVYGISPFTNDGDAVSNYIHIDYLLDVYKNFEAFDLEMPNLTKAYSTDDKATTVIKSKFWDCIYIDGSHDYEIAKLDWKNCSNQVKVGGVIVMDDSSLYTNYQPPFFAFKGHPGPSSVANEIDTERFKEVLRVGHNRVFERLY